MSSSRRSKMPRVLGLLLAVTVGLGLTYSGGVAAATHTIWAASVKIRGRAPACPWPQVLTMYTSLSDFARRTRQLKAALTVEDYDEEFGIEHLTGGPQDYWIRRDGDDWDGKQLLAYHLAEHDWIASREPDKLVQPGDIVIDCGAHVGVFTRKALALGAETVVAVEPDPVQAECLRRNLAEEIQTGRVILVPEAVWSSEGTMTLSTGAAHSGMSSLVKERGGEKVEVQVTTIDRLVSRLGLPSVDYIKLDIEGAEREALRGGLQTLRRHRPRLLLDSYHLDDDMIVLPGIIAQAHADYRASCGACEPSEEYEGYILPHYVFYR